MIGYKVSTQCIKSLQIILNMAKNFGNLRLAGLSRRRANGETLDLSLPIPFNVKTTLRTARDLRVRLVKLILRVLSSSVIIRNRKIFYRMEYRSVHLITVFQ